MKNVVSKNCEHPKCETRVSYGIPGYNATRCAQHKQEGMILNPKTKCMVPNCKEIAMYGIHKAIHCVYHVQDRKAEVNFVGKKCVECGLIDIVDLESGRCSVCDPVLLKKIRLAKQKTVKLWLDASDDHKDYILYDRIIDKGECGLERPDFLYECGTHYLVLEVDENQHKDRLETCEHARMVNISQSLGLQTIFLRYNPDRFEGGCVNLAKRRDSLLKWITFLKTNPPKEYFLSLVKLFFDGYKDCQTNIEGLIEFEQLKSIT
jgi:hypothetical protein